MRLPNNVVVLLAVATTAAVAQPPTFPSRPAIASPLTIDGAKAGNT